MQPGHLWLLLLPTILLAVVFLTIPHVCAEGARTGLSICANALIPALFPYLVLSGILCPLLNICFGQTARASLIGAFVIGCISGFPIGAISVVRAYRLGAIDRESASRALGICTAASPAFLIGYLGEGLFENAHMGRQLYLYQTVFCTVLLLPLLFRRMPIPTETDRSPPTVPPDIGATIRDAAERMLSLCATVVFFSVLRALLLHLSHSIPMTVVCGLVELSGGLNDIAALFQSGHLSSATANVLCAAQVGFGGICVGMQVISTAADTDLCIKHYWAYRLVLALGLAGTALLLP